MAPQRSAAQSLRVAANQYTLRTASASRITKCRGTLLESRLMPADPPPSTLRSPPSTLSFVPICLCCWGWAFGYGLEFPLASRYLEDHGQGEAFIGANTSTHFIGILLTGLIAPWLLARLGRKAIALGLVLTGLSIALFPWGDPVSWFLFRFLSGAGGVLALLGLETLINLSGNEQGRARQFALYAMAIGGGFAAGACTGLNVYPFSPRLGFLLGGCVTALAAICVFGLPTYPCLPNEKMGKCRAPFLCLGSAWSQGFLEAGMLAFIPIYLRAEGVSDGVVGMLIAVMLVGILVLQWPIGWLGDHIGRESTLVGCFVLVALGLGLLSFSPTGITLMVLLVGVGVGSGAFYPLGLALLGERLPPVFVPRANAWYLAINAAGSLVGPAVTGPMMQYVGQSALFWVGGIVVLGVLLVWLAGEGRSRKKGVRGQGRGVSKAENLSCECTEALRMSSR